MLHNSSSLFCTHRWACGRLTYRYLADFQQCRISCLIRGLTGSYPTNSPHSVACPLSVANPHRSPTTFPLPSHWIFMISVYLLADRHDAPGSYRIWTFAFLHSSNSTPPFLRTFPSECSNREDFHFQRAFLHWRGLGGIRGRNWVFLGGFLFSTVN